MVYTHFQYLSPPYLFFSLQLAKHVSSWNKKNLNIKIREALVFKDILHRKPNPMWGLHHWSKYLFNLGFYTDAAKHDTVWKSWLHPQTVSGSSQPSDRYSTSSNTGKSAWGVGGRSGGAKQGWEREGMRQNGLQILAWKGAVLMAAALPIFYSLSKP